MTRRFRLFEARPGSPRKPGISWPSSATGNVGRSISCLLSGCMVALLLFAIVPGGGFSSGLCLFVILLDVALVAGILFLNVVSREERVAEYYCYLYFLLFFLIPGYVHDSTGKFPFYNILYADEYVLLAAIAVFVFLLCFFAGYHFASRYMRKPLPRSRPQSNVSVGYEIPLAYATVSIAAAMSFGIGNFLATREQVELLMAEVTPAILMASTFPRILAFVAVLICVAALRARLSWTGIVFLLPVSMVFAVLNSPLAIPRFVLFSYLITGLTAFFELSRLRKTALLLTFVIGQFTIFPAVSLLSRGDIRDLDSISLVDFFVSNGDYDGFQSTINVVRYAEEGGYRYGVNLLSAALFFVPREYWPGKSRGTGGEAAAFNGYDFVNISSPLPSEFFVDFGMIGVAVGAALFGAALAKVDDRIRTCRTMPDKVQLFKPASIVGYLFIILRGSLVGVLGPIALTYSIVWFSTRLIEFRRRLIILK